jgi:anti-anti-sigma factor
MAPTLKVSVRPGGHGQSLIVALHGELDIVTVPPLAARFDELLADCPGQLVVDVTKLAFVDAAGLRVLASLRERGSRRYVVVRLAGMSPHMQRLLAIISPAQEAG